MFNRKPSKPKGWLQALVSIPVKDKPKHRLRKGMVGVVALGSAIAAVFLSKKDSEQ